MPQFGEKSLMKLDGNDEFGPRIEEKESEMPIAGMSNEQFLKALRKLKEIKKKRLQLNA